MSNCPSLNSPKNFVCKYECLASPVFFPSVHEQNEENKASHYIIDCFNFSPKIEKKKPTDMCDRQTANETFPNRAFVSSHCGFFSPK